MSGVASLGGPSTFSGTYTLPNFKTCGLATTALNLADPNETPRADVLAGRVGWS